MSGHTHQTSNTKNAAAQANANTKVPKPSLTADSALISNPIETQTAGNITSLQLLQLQRTVGNSAAIRMIQRSHEQACGCAACSGKTASQEASVQRKLDISQSSPTIQRLMTLDTFKSKTWAWGFRNHIKPIDKAVAAYHKNSSGMTSEEKISALQNIVALCETYLNDPKRQTSGRRAGVEEIKNEAENDIAQLNVVESEPDMSVDEPNMSVEEPNMSVDNTAEQPLQVATDEPGDEMVSVDDTASEPNQSIDPSLSGGTSEETTEPNMSVEPTQEMTPVTGEVSENANGVDATPKTPEAKVDPEKAAATEYFNKLVKGEDIFAGTGPQAKSRKDILDILQKHLTDPEFTQAASLIILNVPDSVVEGDKARTVALGHLAVMFKDKTIARNLLDKNTVIVVVPKNKKMTDLPQFSSLAGKKTFDGRNWEDVRGSGGLELNGKIYVAVTEENTLGTDAEGDVSGTQWCYASGYSTTTHETAHVIDMHGLTPEDRKKVDDLYKAKKDKQKNGDVVEWIDGFDYEKAGTKQADAQAAFDEWKTELPGKLTTAGMTEESDRTNAIAWAKYLMVDGGAYAANNYTAWLKQVGVISNTADKIFKKDGTTLFAEINPTSKKAVYGGKQTCYASSHRLEYFAQSANAFFGTNAGTEPYVHELWDAAGEPEKGKRRNGKSEVARIEPDLKAIFDRIFGSKDIDDANPRDKVKQEQAAKANATGG